ACIHVKHVAKRSGCGDITPWPAGRGFLLRRCAQVLLRERAQVLLRGCAPILLRRHAQRSRTMTADERAPNGHRRRTNLVRGGTHRSEFQETCEGIFATSGYVYKSAEEAEAAFKGEN